MHYAFGFCIMWRTLSDYVLALVHYVLALDMHYVLALYSLWMCIMCSLCTRSGCALCALSACIMCSLPLVVLCDRSGWSHHALTLVALCVCSLLICSAFWSAFWRIMCSICTRIMCSGCIICVLALVALFVCSLSALRALCGALDSYVRVPLSV